MASLANQTDVDRLVEAGAPEIVLAHPGMVSVEERCFLYNCVRQQHQEGRLILDAGVFLGASTRAICEALKSRGYSGKIVNSFEYAVFNHHTARAASRLLNKEFQDGDEFRTVLSEILQEYSDQVHLQFGDICESDPNLDGPFSILFIDLMKNANISQFIMKNFFSSIDKNTIIMHQDYFHSHHPWIQFIMGLHKHCFQYVGRPEKNLRINSAIFRVKNADPERFQRSSFELAHDRDSALKVMDDALEFHADPLEQYLVCGSRAAVQAAFEKDTQKVANDMFALLSERGIAYMAIDPTYEFLTKRIRNSIRRFASGQQDWI